MMGRIMNWLRRRQSGEHEMRVELDHDARKDRHEASCRLQQQSTALRSEVVSAAGGYGPYLDRYAQTREPIARLLEKMQEGRDAD